MTYFYVGSADLFNYNMMMKFLKFQTSRFQWKAISDVDSELRFVCLRWATGDELDRTVDSACYSGQYNIFER